MATESASLNSVKSVDIVCGTLQAKLLTKDLSCGSSRCIEFGTLTLTPCEFQREAGKASAKNWKNTIRYRDQPLSRFLKSVVDDSGKRCCRFIGVPCSQDTRPLANSQPSVVPVDAPTVSPDLNHASQPADSSHLPRPPELPHFLPVAQPNFVWGAREASSFSADLDAAYQEIVHWKKNCFAVPRGSSGKAFVRELARLFLAVGEGSAIESIALKAVFVASALLLQKPSRTSKNCDHIRLLDQRLKLWKEGDLPSLIDECRTIQSRFGLQPPNVSMDSETARLFAKLMFEGKTKAALDVVSSRGRCSVLNLDQAVDPDSPSCVVRDVLKSKHPSAQPLYMECLLPGWDNPPPSHPVIFDSLNAAVIRSAALRTKGAAGPSGLDAHCWRRLCTSFQGASGELCSAIALFARRLCTSYLSPGLLSSFLACRLIALDKQPGVRPIGICEVVRRIVAKAALSVIRTDIQASAGSFQLCAGQMAGAEAAIHSVRTLFAHNDCDAILLVDASNAFNSLNRIVALHNIRQLCPPFATLLINTYRSPACLFISGDVLMSEEGTTQGDPLAMPMYALATIPLLKQLPSDVEQVWYADDACACGKLNRLFRWWRHLCSVGPSFGYFVNACKTWLVTKESLRSDAEVLFAGSGVNVTCDGRPYLGAAIGTTAYIEDSVSKKVQVWSEEVKQLSKIAESQPHAAYCAFTHGLSSRWLYICRTVPGISSCLQPLDNIICQVFIPTITGRSPPSDSLRKLFSLPARWGGLGLPVPSLICATELAASHNICEPLCDFISNRSLSFAEVSSDQLQRKSLICKSKAETYSTLSSALREDFDQSLRCAVDFASVKGASSWLTALPLQEHGFALHKSAFLDALALRYGWIPLRAPSLCACGSSFSVDHVLSCPKGGLPSLRHNDVRDLTATLLSEVCSQVIVEPELQPVSNPEEFSLATSNTQEGARLDVAMNGFWGGQSERCFVDVRVFNPYAASNKCSSLSATYKKHENIKRRAYGQRIREVEHASFTPLVMSATGGLAHEATIFYKRLASLLSAKWGDSYAITLGWLRCRLSFSLLRSAISCLRGARSSSGHYDRAPPPMDLVRVESHLMD